MTARRRACLESGGPEGSGEQKGFGLGEVHQLPPTSQASLTVEFSKGLEKEMKSFGLTKLVCFFQNLCQAHKESVVSDGETVSVPHGLFARNSNRVCL